MPKPFSLRLPARTRARLSDRAFGVGLTEEALPPRYLDEGLRTDNHPLVRFLDGPTGRRASMVGRGLDVWGVIATVKDNEGSLSETSEYMEVPLGLIEAAVASYGEFQSEIDDEIQANETMYEEGRRGEGLG